MRRAEIAQREAVERVIDFLDLAHYRDSLVAGLPYGVRKVVELGRALATEPKLLLLDEPSSGLNPDETDDMAFWIEDIQKELGITVLMVEHDMNLVSRVSDRVLALNEGRGDRREGTPAEVQSHPAVIEAYLGGGEWHDHPDPPARSTSKSNYGPVQALRGVSLSVPEGKIVTVLGANGAGKTTTLKTISGIIDPLKGQVKFRGAGDPGPLARRDRARRHRARARGARGVSAALGRGQPAHGRLSRAATPTASRRTSRPCSAISRSCASAPSRRRASSPAASSRCWRSRARCWRGPSLILMDEPSLGLSPKLTKEIFDIVVRINRERGVTILLVEQNAHMALKIADYGYVLEVGRIVMEDTGARLAEKDDIKEFYLGMKAAGARGARRWKRKKLWR